MWERLVPQDDEEKQIAGDARKAAIMSRAKEQLGLLVIMAPFLYLFSDVLALMVILALVEAWFLFSRTISTRWWVNSVLRDFRENHKSGYKLY